MTSGRIATILDREMLRQNVKILPVRANPYSIAPPGTFDRDLKIKKGTTVAREVGGRYLLKYVLADQQSSASKATTHPVWLTPTPLDPDEASSILALPRPSDRRELVVLIDPR